MSGVPLPHNEAQRIAALHGYQILDTPPEPEFDELARLAADICGTPIALITLVESDRQWFKAKYGVGWQETPRSVSFCAHAICQPDGGIFEVQDAQGDARFRENPLVTDEPRIRFYAGAPLVTDDGAALGTLCVIDRQPRTLTEVQRRGLLALRRFVLTSLSLRQMVARQQAMIRELDAARSALEAAKQMAEDATRAKDLYIAATSHELRTPMNAVIGMSTLLQTTQLDPEQEEYVNTIRGSGELMVAVINDVLDFSKLEAGKVELESAPFDVRRSIERAADLLRPETRRKQIGLRTLFAPGVPAVVTGDALRLSQIVVNLLSNAVKFTDRGEILVQVSAQTIDPGACQLTVSVRDSGVGMSPEQLSRLFRPYQQADTSTTRRFGGTGLGLVISKRFAELHGGRMWVESTPGVGSEFHFTVKVGLPANGAPPPAAPASLLAPDLARRFPAAILVADDNPVNQRVATRSLEKLGYAPVAVGSGSAALEALRRRSFDVVLMDIEMPEMDGLEATRRLRAELPADRQPIVIALTAHAMADQKKRFLEAGMDSTLTKPLRVEELTAELIAALSRRAARTVQVPK